MRPQPPASPPASLRPFNVPTCVPGRASSLYLFPLFRPRPTLRRSPPPPLLPPRPFPNPSSAPLSLFIELPTGVEFHYRKQSPAVSSPLPPTPFAPGRRRVHAKFTDDGYTRTVFFLGTRRFPPILRVARATRSRSFRMPVRSSRTFWARRVTSGLGGLRLGWTTLDATGVVQVLAGSFEF